MDPHTLKMISILVTTGLAELVTTGLTDKPVIKEAVKILEKQVKDRVKRMLKKYDAYWFMPVQSGYGATTLDFLVCHNGRFLGIETKAPGKKPTPRQELVIEQITEAKGHTLVIGTAYFDTMDKFSGESELEAWLLLKP